MKVDPRSGLTEEQLAFLHGRLMAARRDIVERRRRPLEAAPPAATTDPADPGDQAELSFEQAITVERNEADRRRLREIDDALARMEDGHYGVCEATGEPIGFERLGVEPEARYTRDYQRQLEAALGINHPPRL
jgi:DnaK suppressor protein